MSPHQPTPPPQPSIASAVSVEPSLYQPPVTLGRTIIVMMMVISFMVLGTAAAAALSFWITP